LLDGGFNLRTGKPQGCSDCTVKYSKKNKLVRAQVDMGTSYYDRGQTRMFIDQEDLYVGSRSGTHEENMKMVTQNFSKNLNYDLHMGMKIDFLIWKETELIRAAETELLKKICDLERDQKLQVLQVALVNQRLAGYLLTGNRSQFLQIHGAIAWLYNCEEKLSNHLQVEYCYNKIPIETEQGVRFVDPISRQTFKTAIRTDCADIHGNLFQMDPDDQNSWFTLQPEPRKYHGVQQ
ncbi:MAG: hypothetical protein GY827_06755, partial [Cytophagales bacterium]|nr:hypothetical protein [Cytophagales bacterium]